MTTGKTIALTRRTFVGKVMSLLFNMLSRLVITFLHAALVPLNKNEALFIFFRTKPLNQRLLVKAAPEDIWETRNELGDPVDVFAAESKDYIKAVQFLLDWTFWDESTRKQLPLQKTT